MSEGTTKRVLSELVNEGKLLKATKGSYRLPD